MPPEETARIIGLNQAEFYGFDLVKLQPIAERIGPTPEELGQTDPGVFEKWEPYRQARRPWLTDHEAWDITTRKHP